MLQNIEFFELCSINDETIIMPCYEELLTCHQASYFLFLLCNEDGQILLSKEWTVCPLMAWSQTSLCYTLFSNVTKMQT